MHIRTTPAYPLGARRHLFDDPVIEALNASAKPTKGMGMFGRIAVKVKRKNGRVGSGSRLAEAFAKRLATIKP